MATEKKKKAAEIKSISFKISAERFAELQRYAEGQKDIESGVTLSAAQGARRLVLEALDRLRERDQKKR